jgi:hypothetical protein
MCAKSLGVATATLTRAHQNHIIQRRQPTTAKRAGKKRKRSDWTLETPYS